MPSVSGGTSGGASQQSGLTRFERARILGARALQISLGAPLLVDTEPGVVDPVTIAEMELEANVIPITVRRGVPPRGAPA